MIGFTGDVPENDFNIRIDRSTYVMELFLDVWRPLYRHIRGLKYKLFLHGDRITFHMAVVDSEILEAYFRWCDDNSIVYGIDCYGETLEMRVFEINFQNPDDATLFYMRFA